MRKDGFTESSIFLRLGIDRAGPHAPTRASVGSDSPMDDSDQLLEEFPNECRLR